MSKELIEINGWIEQLPDAAKESVNAIYFSYNGLEVVISNGDFFDICDEDNPNCYNFNQLENGTWLFAYKFGSIEYRAFFDELPERFKNLSPCMACDALVPDESIVKLYENSHDCPPEYYCQHCARK